MCMPRFFLCFVEFVVFSFAFCCFQVFGGNGFNCDYPVEKLMRDAKIFQVRLASSLLCHLFQFATRGGTLASLRWSSCKFSDFVARNWDFVYFLEVLGNLDTTVNVSLMESFLCTWLAPWSRKMNRILVIRVGRMAISWPLGSTRCPARKQCFFHLINPLLPKPVRWLGISLVFFCVVIDLVKTRKKVNPYPFAICWLCLSLILLFVKMSPTSFLPSPTPTDTRPNVQLTLSGKQGDFSTHLRFCTPTVDDFPLTQQIGYKTLGLTRQAKYSTM